MPQMMPLYWAPLFLMFSMLLMLTFSKIYFMNNKPFLDSNFQKMEEKKESSKTMWVW